MSDVERLLDEVRARSRDLVASAHERMLQGAPIDRVMSQYVTAGFDLEEEADAQTHLAAAGSENALAAMEECVRKLDELRDELEAEFPGQESRDDRDI